MLYVCQLDYPYIVYDDPEHILEDVTKRNGRLITAASSACGPCSAMMVLDRLCVAHKMTLVEALDLARECDANERPGTDMKKYAPAFAEKFKLKLEMTNDPERLRYCLRTGGAAIVHSGGDREGHVGVFTHGGHYIAAISETEDGKIVVLDPSQKTGKYIEEGRVGKAWFNEFEPNIVYTDMQVLVDDSANRDPGFYLFWRK